MGRIEEYRADVSAARSRLLAEVLARHNNEEPHTDMARDYGVSREYIRQLVREAGGAPRRKKWMPEGAVDEAVAIIRGGGTLRAAVEKTGMSQSHIRECCKAAGVRRKSRGRPRTRNLPEFAA